MLFCAAVGAAPEKMPVPPIQGQVVDEAGKPVPGAEVFYSGRGDGRQAIRMAADGEGRFSLEPPKGYAFVAAAAPGRALAGAALPPGSRKVLLRMGTSREIAGKVLAPDGKAAEGVAVRVTSVTQTGDVTGGMSLPGIPGRFPAFLPENARERFTVLTDAAGAYRLPGLPAGQVRVELRDPRFVTQYLEVTDTPPDVRLEPGGRIHGKIAGFEPRFKGWRAWCMPRGPGGAEVTPVDPGGRFLLSGLPPGEYPVVILAAEDDAEEALTAVPSVTVTVTPKGPDADAKMQVVPTHLLVGLAVDATTKAPLPRVPISYNGPHRPANALTPMVMSGEDGVFRIRMPAGKARLALNRYTEGRSSVQAMEIEVEAGRENTVEFAVRDWLTLSGIVVDAQGNPAPGAMATAEWAGWFHGSSAATGPDGRFRLVGLPNLEARLSARRGEDATLQDTRVKPPFPAEVRLQIGPRPQVTLIGRVVDDQGRPQPDVMVSLRQIRRQEGQIQSERYADQAATDKEGRFRFTAHELAGEYRVRPASQEQRALRGGEPLGDTGAERRFSDLVILSTRGSVSGRVVDAKGQAVAGVSVFWASGTKATLAVSNAEGRFRIAGLPERPVALVARGPKGSTVFVQATPGQEAVLVLKE